MSNPPLSPKWRIEANLAPIASEAFDLYMIIEPELWPDWKERLYWEIPSPIHIPLFEKTQFANIEQGPILIGLDEQSKMFTLALEKMQNIPCGCLLYVRKGTSTDQLVATLRNALVVKTDKATAILRYYEPRTLLPLLGSMTEEERSLLFQNIEQIHWYQAEWLFVRLAHSPNSTKHHQWTLTPEHITSMQSILTQRNGAV